jgi:hypothetical protein
MTEHERLSVREAVEWCGDEITTREATRLRRVAEAVEMSKPKVDVKNSAVGSVDGLAMGAARQHVRGAASS